MTAISRDLRFRAWAWLLVPAFVAHTLQLFGEDRPWSSDAAARYWYQPGWHLFLPPWVIVALAGLLGLAVLGLAVRRTRPWIALVIALYVAHYLTYPFRIRNHMSHMFFSLTMVGTVWLVGASAVGRRLLDVSERATRTIDRHAVTGLALVVCTTYFFAGLHKINDTFLTVGPASAAVSAIGQFWIHADLGSVPPRWVQACAIYGTVLIEGVVPIVAWRSRRLRVPAFLTLMLFHYPMISTMNVSDYPMIVAASYPCLFDRAHFRLLLRHLGPSRWTLGGASLGVAMQAWAVPWWGSLTIFGLFVMALFGWSAAAMIRMSLAGVLARR